MHVIEHKLDSLYEILEKKLKPQVKKIDGKSLYYKDIFKILGERGYFSSEGLSLSDVVQREVEVVKETSRFCMTTGFIIWCHLAALTYLRHSDNSFLRNNILPQLESGETIAGTGLSNPMKYYAGLEKLHLSARQVVGGYVVNGTLPSVSNLGDDHWFGVIAEVSDNQRVMLFIPCNAEGLSMKEKIDYMGINGSGTFACRFNEVFIPEEQVIAENADQFVKRIRPSFVVYQIPLGLGVIQSSLLSINKCKNRQNGCNEFLPIQGKDVEEKLSELGNRLKGAFATEVEANGTSVQGLGSPGLGDSFVAGEASVEVTDEASNVGTGEVTDEVSNVGSDEASFIREGTVSSKSFYSGEDAVSSPSNVELDWKEILAIRRDAATATHEAVHAAMLHGGGAAYLNNSEDGRRLREAYFLLNLTPTLKHLGKMLQS
ncbi:MULTISPECIES: acyl-CoA dehydrogenase family protein [Bacillaceae]|uniref:Acyl-CoA/acyl-ACP dehydrogenase n=1 Tax=Evansella alkalicola TaxID=745819 RepID=A0ABS6JUZ7_9BACI|nr:MULTISPECIES: acyl-CoA dehydrogenase family protein [Bacillaceae]MBU9722411.1 acyl-CoA/acyl-ACP dehydrogenase [Bacillus alkalicola]